MFRNYTDGTDLSISFYKAGDYEKSYFYARELSALGLPILYENFCDRTSGAKDKPSVNALYEKLGDMIENLKDKGEYSIKYITTGAYPLYERKETDDVTLLKLLETAGERGECVALIDHSNIPGRPLTGATSVYGSVNGSDSVFKKEEAIVDEHKYLPSACVPYAAMFTPWSSFKLPNENINIPKNQIMPASFGYLLALAKSVKTNANWLAAAGVARGVVPYITATNTTTRLTNTIADSYQPKTGIAINAITNIKPYGLTIWGNRTLIDNGDAGVLTARSFLNTRNMVNDIKKVAYTTAKSLMFEQNSEQLWLSFKAGIIPTLDQMQSGQGLSGYKIIRKPTTEKAKMIAIIKLYPIYAVEDFEITVYLENEEVTVE